MFNQDDHQLDTLIRVVDPATFPVTANKPGDLIIFDTREQQVVDSPSLLDKLFSGKDRFVHYFVKHLGKPLAINGWQFEWRDGASKIALAFSADFGIRVSDTNAVHTLVGGLHRPEGPSCGLHTLIDKVLHQQVAALVERCLRTNANLLEHLLAGNQDGRPEGLVSAKLNQDMSTALTIELGVEFAISFVMTNLPKRQLPLDKHVTVFNASDFAEQREVATSVHLELSNFQNYQRSGLRSESEVMNQIKQVIDDAVKSHLFGKPYYDIASKFDAHIQPEIKRQVEERVAAIGYRIKMFQTLPNIGVLCLTRGLRVELDSEHAEFKPRFANNAVRMDVALELHANDFRKIAHLLRPGMSKSDIRDELVARLEQVCKDVISHIDRKQFNLNFDALPAGDIAKEESVVAQLKRAFASSFDERYGLTVTVINISQAQTEEGERFTSIRGQPTDFELNISAQADVGLADKVQILGVFEVINIAEAGWDQFQSKDFGFGRSSPKWTASRIAAVRSVLRGVNPNFTKHDEEKECKAIAIAEELAEIARRLTGILENAISKIPDLANRSRAWQDVDYLRSMAQKMAQDAIAAEFGLEIVFRQFRRNDTLSEIAHATLHELKVIEIIEQGKRDLLHGKETGEIKRDKEKEYLGNLLDYKINQLNREPDEEPTHGREWIEQEIVATVQNNDWQAIKPESVLAVLERKQADKKDVPRLGSELAATHALTTERDGTS